jgi:hypothetical protein
MFFRIAESQFLRGIFVGLVFATMLAGAGMVYTAVAVPSPAGVMTISSLSP